MRGSIEKKKNPKISQADFLLYYYSSPKYTGQTLSMCATFATYNKNDKTQISIYYVFIYLLLTKAGTSILGNEWNLKFPPKTY